MPNFLRVWTPFLLNVPLKVSRSSMLSPKFEFLLLTNKLQPTHKQRNQVDFLLNVPLKVSTSSMLSPKFQFLLLTNKLQQLINKEILWAFFDWASQGTRTRHGAREIKHISSSHSISFKDGIGPTTNKFYELRAQSGSYNGLGKRSYINSNVWTPTSSHSMDERKLHLEKFHTATIISWQQEYAISLHSCVFCSCIQG